MTYQKKDTNAPNMRGRAARTKDGTLRALRDDMYVRTLEEHYGVDFGVRDDMTWGTLQKKLGVDDIKSALEKIKNSKK